MASPSPPPEVLAQYKRDMANRKEPTRIPNEDFTKLKQDILDLRALVTERKAKRPEETIGEADISNWCNMFEDLALKRPTLFRLVINPEKDIEMALGMVDILNFQRTSKNNSIEDANHKLIHYMCDQTGFSQGKEWLAQSEKERRESRRRRKT